MMRLQALRVFVNDLQAARHFYELIPVSDEVGVGREAIAFSHSADRA